MKPTENPTIELWIFSLCKCISNYFFISVLVLTSIVQVSSEFHRLITCYVRSNVHFFLFLMTLHLSSLFHLLITLLLGCKTNRITSMTYVRKAL